MKLALINVRFSPNLGDGVIAECIEFALRERLPDLDVVHCDLAGRTEFGSQSSFLRSLAMTVLPSAPASIRESVYARMLETYVRRKLIPHYDETINGSNAAIFGGGQLLADADLNFPMKIAGAASILRRRHIAIAIHAVGVGRNWSTQGAELFKEAFAGADVSWTSVRDDTSLARWNRHFQGLDVPAPRISLDPALLAAKTYPDESEAPTPRRNRPLIGLCVTHPNTLEAHFDGVGEAASPDVAFYRDCALKLIEADYDVLAFTNGAHDDEKYLHRCFTGGFCKRVGEAHIEVAPRSIAPRDLVALIRRCDVIASHRLHSCIVAYSCKVPNVGMSLNRKLDGFFDTVGRNDFLLKNDELTSENLASAVRRAVDSPILDASHVAIRARVERDFDDLAHSLSSVAPDQRKNSIDERHRVVGA